LRHLIRLARAGGVRELVALVLDENPQMLEVLRNLNLPEQRTIEYGVHHVVLSLANTADRKPAWTV